MAGAAADVDGVALVAAGLEGRTQTILGALGCFAAAATVYFCSGVQAVRKASAVTKTQGVLFMSLFMSIVEPCEALGRAADGVVKEDNRGIVVPFQVEPRKAIAFE